MKEFFKIFNENPFHLISVEKAKKLVFKLQCIPGDGCIRLIRGSKCVTPESLFNEVSAALQFPSYFGENWDALDECIIDLEWCPARWYLLYIPNAENILQNDDKSFNIFLSVLWRAAEAWSKPELRGLAINEPKTRRPFNIIFSGTKDGITRVTNWIENRKQKHSDAP